MDTEQNEVKPFKVKWKKLKNFGRVVNDRYEVSNDGHIIDTEKCEEKHFKTWNKRTHPYYSVSLKTISGTLEWFLVHRIVAFVFCEIPEGYTKNDLSKLVVDHLDNNGLNNVYTNLEWVTSAENTRRSVERNDRQHYAPRTIKDPETIHKICELLETDMSYDEILDTLGIARNFTNIVFVRDLKLGKACPEISNNYDIDRTSVRATNQNAVIQNLVLQIKAMINAGYANGEICDIIWEDLPHSTRKSRVRTIHHIREGRIYKNIPADPKPPYIVQYQK